MKLQKKTTALLLIDFQKDFCEKGGYADKFAGSVSWAKPVIPKARRLLEFAREHKLLIIHTREGYKPDLSDCDVFRLARSKKAGVAIGSKGPMGRLLIRGERGQDFIDSLYPKKGEVVIDKAAYGAFTNTGLLKILRKKKIRELILAGVTADVCVHTTLRQATDFGFYCYYVKDAIGTPDPFLKKACEKMIETEGGIWGKLIETKNIIKAK